MSNGDSVETNETVHRPVVCDAGPVIHLDELGCLDLLNDLSPVIVPGTVRQEIERHRPTALRRPGFSWRHIEPNEPISPALLALSRILPLHDGEVDALRVAVGHPEALFLTDDTAARIAARSLQIPVHGTIGILMRSIRRRQRSSEAVAAVLRELPHRSTLHVKPTLLPLLQEFIRTVEDLQSDVDA